MFAEATILPVWIACGSTWPEKRSTSTLWFTPICFSAEIIKWPFGRTSITVHLEAWVLRRKAMHSILVTDGNFTYVAIDDQGHPQAITPGAGTTVTA